MANEYTPDNWVVLKINNPEGVLYKVLGGWSGGFLDGDSWRMNSGITKAEKDGQWYLFHGMSGSVYRCHEKSNHFRMNNSGIYEKLVATFGEDMVQLMPNETDWVSYDYTKA